MSKDPSTTVESITGTIKMKDGTVRSFNIGTDFGWQQWGESQDNLGNSVPVIEGMVGGLMGNVEVVSDHDADDEYEPEVEDEPETYSLYRFYQSDEFPREIIATGLDLEEALAATNDPETSSETATSEEALRRTAMRGPWFVGKQVEA